MDDGRDIPTTIRLNVLGGLEIERAGEPLPLPTTTAAHQLLALFAVKERYEDQQLVDILWPGRYLDDDRDDTAKAVRGSLDRAISNARTAVGVDASSGVLKRKAGIVDRVDGYDVTISSDLEDFRRLARSERPEDWRAALALIRGPIAQYVPTRKRSTDWIRREQSLQKEDIRKLLARLDPDASEETIENQAQDVLDGRWQAMLEAPPAGRHRPAADDTETGSQLTNPVSTPPGDASTKPGRWRSRKRYGVAGLITTLAAVAALIVLSPPGKGVSIPSEGSVVDAQTGAIVAHPVVTVSHLPAQIGGGPTFHACDISAPSPCGYGRYGRPPLNVKVGDVIAFRLVLNDGTSTPLNYVKLNASSVPAGHVPDELGTELEVGMSVKWPESLGAYEAVSEPGRISGSRYHMPGIDPIYLQLPRAGHYGLAYIPGSTSLANDEAHFFHYLPDGIMNYGIALENVGPPPSCFWCALQYVRSVYFHAKVTASR
jgi:DNA-binding SARP family transcriptional activator